MTADIVLALIGLISGGGLTAILKMLLDNAKSKQAVRDKELDERIAVWQQLSQQNKDQLKQLEKKLDSCEEKMASYDRDFWLLERYIVSLERTIAHATPPLELPDRPALERDLQLVAERMPEP